MRLAATLIAIALAAAPLGAMPACHPGASAPGEIPAAPGEARTEQPPVCARVTTPFVGTLCSRADGRRHAAIVLFGGYTPGDPMRATALAFAERGYLAASVVYYGAAEEGTPPVLVDVPVEIGAGAIAALAERPDVDPSRVAVMGQSKGGEYALLVASAVPQVKAVVATVPSPFALFGLGANGTPTGCSWSRAGKPLPCVPQDASAGEAVWHRMQDHQPVAFRDSNDASRVAASPDTMKAAFFPLEQIRGPVLCLAAADDQIWNSAVHCELALARLRVQKHPFADRMIAYPGAGHLFLLAQNGPGSALNRVHAGSYEMLFGGTPEADARAASEAWPQIHAFLDAALR